MVNPVTLALTFALAALVLAIYYALISKKQKKEIAAARISLDLLEDYKRADQNESRYRSLVANVPMCIHEIDLSGKIISMNRSGLDMLQLDDENEIIGESVLNMISNEDRSRVYELLHLANSGTNSQFEFTGTSVLEGRILSSGFVPIRDAEGTVTLILGVTWDISQRKQMENELRKLAQVVEQNPQSIVITNINTFQLIRSVRQSRRNRINANGR